MQDKATGQAAAGSSLRASHEEICFLPATEMAARIQRKELSAREVMQAHLQQIRRVNAQLNAFVTLLPEDELMAQAVADIKAGR